MSHTINTLIAEDKAYYTWLNEQKNRILNMANEERKQTEWNKYFMKTQPDDSYLDGEIF